jgi:hypothetical protein
VQAGIACAVFPMLSETRAFPCKATSSLGERASAASKSAAACSSLDSSRLTRPRFARIFAEPGLIASAASSALFASS